MEGIQYYAVIVAGGKGARMGQDIPKQFLEIEGMPILARTLLRFKTAVPQLHINLVLPEMQVDYWKSWVKQANFQITHNVVTGGKSRFQSVRNGLNAIDASEAGVVAIHDGVRPFVHPQTIRQAFEKALEKGNAIVSMPMKDSIRELQEENRNEARDRSKFRIIQTPQTFQLALIKQAFLQEESPLFTDDASVAEHAGQRIHLIDGSYDNIKITTPEDLPIANAIANYQQALNMR